MTKRRRWDFALPLLLGILLAGAGLTWRMVVSADRAKRADLLAQTQLLAHALDPDIIQTLSATEADLQSPAYLRLKEQLALTRVATPQCRFIYLMGRRPAGELYFFVDSEDLSSKDYSPPGQIYQEAPDSYRRVFTTKTATTEGPCTDRWGTWVTGFVPIYASRANALAPEPAGVAGGGPSSQVGDSGEAVLAVLGMDIDARDWNWMLARAALPPALLTLALVALVVLGRVLLAQRARCSEPLSRRMRYLEPMLALVGGLVLTLFATWMAHQTEARDRELAFKQLAVGRSGEIAETLQAFSRTELESLASFCQQSKNFSRDEYQSFTAYLVNKLMVQAWKWVPVVAAAERVHFEEQTRAAG